MICKAREITNNFSEQLEYPGKGSSSLIATAVMPRYNEHSRKRVLKSFANASKHFPIHSNTVLGALVKDGILARRTSLPKYEY